MNNPPPVPFSFKVTGRPITPDLREVFGAFGNVTGIRVDGSHIDVQYEDGLVVTFAPIFHPLKQDRGLGAARASVQPRAVSPATPPPSKPKR
jgi:hypothetical protein